MYTYKNKTTETLTIINVGVVEAGKTITTDQIIENPLLELTETEETEVTPTPAPVVPVATPQVVATQAPQQNSVSDVIAAPIEITNKETLNNG